MDPLLQNVLGIAVWGSLAATVLLGAFSAVQAAVDPLRRYRFLFFSLVMVYLGGLDLFRSLLRVDPLSYEWMRLWWGALYAGSVLSLLGFSLRTALATGMSLLALGLAVFHGVNPGIATTIAFPCSFAISACAFARRYWERRGYASIILATFSTAMAIMCACYFSVLNTQNPKSIISGYAQYALISIFSVLMGWVHLPRELRGRAPVKMNLGPAIAFFLLVVASEVLVMAALLDRAEQPPLGFILGVLLQVAATVGIYLYHRHQLVIYADNVGQLLEERTAALVEAKKSLAQQNEILAQKLAEQMRDLQEKNRDLQAKNEVIDRQRRLELAAQTAGQVAHDIQNLISPIFTGIESLEEVSALTDVRSLTRDLRQQVGQLLDLNTNLLALARRGRVELHPVDLNQLVSDLARRFPGQRLSLESRGQAWVTGSYAQLLRAASNLLMNAFESDLDRLVPVVVRTGVVEITQNRRCHLGFLGAGCYAYLEVEDQGPGIPRELVDKVFEPFFSSKMGRHKSGSGLGLSIVAAVVDDHRGVIDLASSPAGTRFTLFFPALAAPFEGDDLSKLSCNATVLVVDDDTSILREYGPFLEEAGYEVIGCETGERVFRVLQTQDVDLILLDLNLPRIDGVETLLGAINVRPGIRAVVHSSHVSEEQSLRLKALGVSSYLPKPAARLDVLRALRQAYDEKAAEQCKPGSPRT